MKTYKNIIILLIIICSTYNVSASCTAYGENSGHSFSGNGLAEYPNEGVLWASISIEGCCSFGGCTGSSTSPTYVRTSVQPTYSYAYGIADCGCMGFDACGNSNAKVQGTTYDYIGHVLQTATSTYTGSYISLGTNKHSYGGTAGAPRAYSYLNNFYRAHATASAVVIVKVEPIQNFTLSGDTGCIDGVKVYLTVDSTDYLIYNKTLAAEDSYSVETVNNSDYKIVFSDGHTYAFTCTGDKIYDYNMCAYLTINLKDYCGNTMTNTSVDIYKSDGGNMASYDFVGTYLRINPIQILINTDVEEGKMLDIYMDTDMGAYHVIDYCEEKTLDILHPTKYWVMSFGAFDEDTLSPIEGMRITMNQSCVINPEHPLKQYLFTGVNGYGTFIGLSAEVMHVRQSHPDYSGQAGYTSFFIDPFGDAFSTYLSIDTYFNTSDPEFVDGDNQTENVTEGCNIWFVDSTGKRDTHINDTDTYVDLYYNNSNCTATLKFQRLYGTYWMTKRSFNIPALTAGYKRIYNVNFSDGDANYRGFLYASECECNITRSLYVTNQTIEKEQHYENLTAHCKFKHKMGGGQVDYRSPVEVLAYAYSNTSHTLLNINLTLYELTTQIASKQCDWADFAGASPKWFYVWSPNVEYDTGKNYTVVMTGYNGLNLDADGVWTSNIRNNKLTVNVRDNHNTPLAYSTVFVQDWGSQALDSQTSFIVSGLQDGVYQYKATKSGYTSSGWASVNFSGEDKEVTCVLVEQETSSITGYKLKDDEIKAFFIPLMYMLMVMILIGGLMNASKR